MQLFQASALLVAIAGLPPAEGQTPTYAPLPTYSPSDPPTTMAPTTLSCEDVDEKFKLIKPNGKKIGGFKEKTVECALVDEFIRFGGGSVGAKAEAGYYYDDYYYSKGGKSSPKITRGELVCGLDVVGGGFVHEKCGVTCHTNGFPCT